MKIYILREYMTHVHPDIIGFFSTKKKAQKAKEDAEKFSHEKYDDAIWYTIEEKIVK